jgi:hypothetical protein
VKHEKQGIEVAQLVSGEVVSVRVLSSRAERRAALAAGGTAFGLAALSGAIMALVLALGGRIVHAPTFVALWVAVGLAVATLAAARASARARRYLVGVDIEDDAFAPLPQALVRRVGQRYELALAPGIRGIVEEGSATLDVEALGREGRARVPLRAGMRAEITFGAATFVARGATTFVVRARPAVELGAPDPLPRGFWRPVARRALVPIQLAAVVAFLRAVPLGAPLGEEDMKSAIPADATPWEAEKLLRQEAQTQARTLHACFDPLPVTCQRPGYVGVGLSLSRQGEIRSSWIARSTYGRDCPVESCMSNVIATWFFEPLPESMRIVLPVQVLRTDKPLPLQAALGPASTSGTGAPFRNAP